MSDNSVAFIQSELKSVKENCEKKVKDSKLVACVPAMVRVVLEQTQHKSIVVCLMFPDKYPDATILIELKSKTLSYKLLQGLTKVAEEEAKKYLGREQVLMVLKFIRNFIQENPLCVCSEEISFIKKDLLQDCDDIKLKQKLSQIILKVKKDQYFMNFKITIPDNYPFDQSSIEVADHNFPEPLTVNILAQANEIARRCVQPPLKKRPKDPPFEPKPAVRPVCEYMIRTCIKNYPAQKCPLCNEMALPENPQEIINEPNHEKFAERVYCGHTFHHGCLDIYMKTPPFTGGKKCPSCSNRIYHENWKVTPELAEARWAHQEARRRELDEVVDFLE
ncbi:uncharacterized protein LOC106155069 [Lingula anatina]|uniref:Uncharacterized protein LOC106155069 n=1 Tax=Lingula anatina TaxID=7574 RepID=A0A2R2MN69_LINAN|nr:uncharacterized protein LOC106155069 [Lingula anatina]|eukprot:XP_023931502.1 uncharacterized protein LOC106155069 [Lingula anatina]